MNSVNKDTGAVSQGDTEGAVAPPINPYDVPLYADRVQIYPRSIDGMFRRLKWAALIILLGIYYIVPWLRWDRGPGVPDQAVLVDMPNRRLYFFMIEIWPQEVYYLTGLLIIGAIGLFMVTAIAGRVWCGFACPQTVWTDLFFWVERLIEGDRNARMKLAKGPLTAAKMGKKLSKHLVWLLISVLTGGAWVWYFADAPTVTREILTLEASSTVWTFIALFTATTYLLGGWAREQVCVYMCPWPRFQGAMFDEDSLIVTYEQWRGEPRGHAKKGQSFDGRGHCVDCGMCVQVCPTGVDIREGNQMACIGCALCIDACNTVMDRFSLPRGLISYDSNHNLVARQHGEVPRKKTHIFRPRTFAYLFVLGVVVAVMGWGLANRSSIEINVLRDRAPLFVNLSDGRLRNGYTYKVLNMERLEKQYTLSVEGIDQAVMNVVGFEENDVPTVKLPVAPDTVGSFRVLVKAPKSAVNGKSTPMTFVLRDESSGVVVRSATVFAGPGK